MLFRSQHRQPRQRTGGTPGPPLNPSEDVEVPGTQTPGRRPDSLPGTNPHTREEDKLASPGWKLTEDLGAKKMEAPRGAGTEKLSVPVRPHGKGGRCTYPPLEEYLDEKMPRRPLRRTRRGFPAKTPPAPGCTCGIPLAYKRRAEAPKGKGTEQNSWRLG